MSDQHRVAQDSVTYVLNPAAGVAVAVSSLNFLPSVRFADSITLDGRDYPVVAIGPRCCQAFSCLTAAEFGDASALLRFAEEAFAESTLRAIALPKTVETIAEKCFHRCARLTAVGFADGAALREIESLAFAECAIPEISVPSSVETIGDSAFCMSKELCNVTFSAPSQLKRIDSYAFAETALATVALPPSLEAIGHFAFSHCPKLTAVTIADTGALWSIGDGAFAFSGLESFRLPETVRRVAPGLCYLCIALAAVEFGGRPQIEAIDAQAFFGARVERIAIPESVRSIGAMAFHQSRLTTATFEGVSQLEAIEDSAFAFSAALVQIALPPSLSRLGVSAFEGCRALSAVTLSNLAVVPPRAFADTGLRTLAIPASVKRISDSAFCECPHLVEVTFSKDSVLRVIENFAFAGTVVTKLTFPRSLLCIGASAFSSCLRLSAVAFELSSELIRIEANAFADCRLLSAFAFPDNLRVIGAFAFARCTQLSTVRLSPFLHKIEIGAFLETPMRELNLPGTLKQIEKFAFLHCRQLALLRFPFHAKTVLEHRAFHDTAITTVAISASSKDNGAFPQDCEVTVQSPDPPLLSPWLKETFQQNDWTATPMQNDDPLQRPFFRLVDDWTHIQCRWTAEFSGFTLPMENEPGMVGLTKLVGEDLAALMLRNPPSWTNQLKVITVVALLKVMVHVEKQDLCYRHYFPKIVVITDGIPKVQWMEPGDVPAPKLFEVLIKRIADGGEFPDEYEEVTLENGVADELVRMMRDGETFEHVLGMFRQREYRLLPEIDPGEVDSAIRLVEQPHE
jgi:hypothetical protein